MGRPRLWEYRITHTVHRGDRGARGARSRRMCNVGSRRRHTRGTRLLAVSPSPPGRVRDPVRPAFLFGRGTALGLGPPSSRNGRAPKPERVHGATVRGRSLSAYSVRYSARTPASPAAPGSRGRVSYIVYITLNPPGRRARAACRLESAWRRVAVTYGYECVVTTSAPQNREIEVNILGVHRGRDPHK